MASGKLGSQITDINVTPFVDVMLVLLIIFMVTAPMIQRGVNIDLPQADAGTITYHEDQLMVIIDRKGRVKLQNQAITIAKLRKKLTAIAKDNKNAEVYLSADRNVRYGIVVQTIAAIKGAGITRLGMVTNPPKGKEKT